MDVTHHQMVADALFDGGDDDGGAAGGSSAAASAPPSAPEPVTMGGIAVDSASVDAAVIEVTRCIDSKASKKRFWLAIGGISTKKLVVAVFGQKLKKVAPAELAAFEAALVADGRLIRAIGNG
jgi:hypothetical protein